MKYVDFNIDNEWDFVEEDPTVNHFEGFEDFYEFLEKYNAVEKYINDFIKIHKHDNINKFLIKNKRFFRDIISESFTWKLTDNSELWVKLHDRWGR